MTGLLHKSSHQFSQIRSRHSCVHTKGGIPVIVPCLMGEELAIDSELVNKGLSAISIKHKMKPEDPALSTMGSRDHVIKCTISITKKSSHGLKQRNSFWNVHRPDLVKLNLDPNEITLRKVETFFRQHSSTQCLVQENHKEEKCEKLMSASSFHDMSKGRGGMLILSRSFVVANDSPNEKEISLTHSQEE